MMRTSKPLSGRHLWSVLSLFFLCAMPCTHVSASTARLLELRVFPPSLNLTDFNPSQTIIVQGVYSDKTTRDLSKHIKASHLSGKLNEQIKLKHNQGKLSFSAKTGTHSGELKLHFQGKSKAIPTKIAVSDKRRDISYRLDVYPIFMRAGCNSGDCHGAARGKDGFNLSLFGYDPKGDYFRLTREEPFRRISLTMPEESLLLTKALGEVNHTGGECITKEQPHYKILLDWLKQGAKDDTSKAPLPESLAIYPSSAVISGPDQTQQFIAVATYENGDQRDVTDMAVFMSSNEHCSEVNDAGLLNSLHRGETFLMARFDKFTVGSEVLVVDQTKDFKWQGPSPAGEIDAAVYDKLKRLRINPAPLADDHTFLRRVTLDLIGQLPTLDEINNFVNSKQVNKREKKIDELLAHKQFSDIWAMKLAELLKIRSTGNNNGLSQKQATLFHQWLVDQVSNKKPFNKLIENVISAQGSTFDHPPAAFYRTENDKLKLMENVAQSFLGMRLQCAKCHNHPFDRWTMDDYYGFAAFFQQVGYKRSKDPRDAVIFNQGSGDVKHPVSKTVIKPQFLGGSAIDIPKGQDRRVVAAKWLTSKDNPYFSRHIANLIWSHFFFRGIIDPYDDIRISNPPTNDLLLSTVSEMLTENNFDLRGLIKAICMSNTYQAASKAQSEWEGETLYFNQMVPRRIGAEILNDVINDFTNTKHTYRGMPRGARSIELTDGASTTTFLRIFGRSERLSVCSCDSTLEPDLSQSLHLINNYNITGRLPRAPIVSKHAYPLARLPKDKQLKVQQLHKPIQELYLTTFSREPTVIEIDTLVQHFDVDRFNSLKSGSSDRVRMLQNWMTDISWALINSKEFLFNH